MITVDFNLEYVITTIYWLVLFQSCMIMTNMIMTKWSRTNIFHVNVCTSSNKLKNIIDDYIKVQDKTYTDNIGIQHTF